MKANGGSVPWSLCWSVILALPLAACITTQKEPAETGKAVAMLEARNTAMAELAQQTRVVTTRLERLEKSEKDAVIALLTLSNAVAAYERAGALKIEEPLRSYYGELGRLSTGYRAPGKFQSMILACFDESVSCATAQQRCRNEGRSDTDCDRDPGVIEACGAEAACIFDAVRDLERVIPDILGGRDPWPPQPFPF